MTRDAVTGPDHPHAVQLATRSAFERSVGAAVAGSRGFAAGKLGGSEQAFLHHAVVRSEVSDVKRRKAFELALAFKAARHAGIFPTEPRALEAFTDRFADDVRTLDAIGLFPDALRQTLTALRHHRPTGMLMDFSDQEPDRSTPPIADWLEHLRGRRVLLVCPFANVLRDRATRATFEAVWAKSGKRWFAPAAVSAIEQPYGFAPETQRRYGTALALLDDLQGRVDDADFDVALIAAGGLGIPLAAHVKRRGRVGISLGGHLQVLFGVLGARWRDDARWQRDVITEAWVDVPARYRPDPAMTGENYW